MIILISIYCLGFKDQIQLPEFTESWNFPCIHPMGTAISKLQLIVYNENTIRVGLIHSLIGTIASLATDFM